MSKLPAALAHLPFPVIGAPLFIISTPQLVIAQCIAGVVGSMPALNARPAQQLEEWLIEITETLAAYNLAHPDQPAAPFAINQIVHKSSDRLEHDMALCVKYKVPIIITSLGAREDINAAAHSYGGVVVDMEGLEYEEAARALGIPIGTVRSRLARARMKLHDILQDFARSRGYA